MKSYYIYFCYFGTVSIFLDEIKRSVVARETGTKRKKVKTELFQKEGKKVKKAEQTVSPLISQTSRQKAEPAGIKNPTGF